MAMAASDPAALLEGIAPEAIRTTLVDAAAIAARETLPRFRTELAVDNKWDVGFDPVTAADREAERAIRDLIAERFPDHGIVGEEWAPRQSDHACQWIIDPIDGTRAFIAGRPDWTISVALVEDGRPRLAALFAPVTEQMFLAERGAGATLNGAAMCASHGDTLAGATIAGPKRYLDRLERLDPSILPQPKVHSLALRLTRVGAGTLDVAFSSGGSQDWDLAAADLLVHEAGGLLTDFAGRPLLFNGGGAHSALVAAGPARHGALLELVRDRMPEFA